MTLEGRRPAVPGEKYPRCTGGERRCPPEDVGGSTGYAEFLEGLADRRHERHEEYERWIGSFDQEEFRSRLLYMGMTRLTVTFMMEPTVSAGHDWRRARYDAADALHSGSTGARCAQRRSATRCGAYRASTLRRAARVRSVTSSPPANTASIAAAAESTSGSAQSDPLG